MAGHVGEGESLVEDIMQDVASEHPLHTWDLTLEIDVTFEAGIVIYAVRVENRSDRVIRKITITPDLDEKIFAILERAKTLGPLPPNSAQTALFRIKPQDESWDLGVASKIVGGRDINLRALLKIRDGETTYELTVENNKRHSLRFLKVRPVLPIDFVALDQEKTINLLPPGGRETVTFDLMPRMEWEMLERHEEGLRKPWMFTPEKPRRKKRGFPRAYSREEMGELKRFLLFTEADEELLALIGDRGIDDEAVEIGLILIYRDVIEEEAVEEEFALRKFHIGEIIEEEPAEAPHDFRPVLKLVPLEEDALEFEFDIEELRDVRPLDLEGATADDIEIEPMEMDI